MSYMSVSDITRALDDRRESGGHHGTLSSLTQSGFNTLSHTHTSHVTSLLECSVCIPLTLMFIDKYTSRNWWQSQDQIFQWHTFSNSFTPCHLKTLFPDNCMLNPAKGTKKVPKIQKYYLTIYHVNNVVFFELPCKYHDI